MTERREGGAPQEMREKEEKRHEKVWGDLATAFGGYSQVPDYVLGMAIMGQVNNGGLEFGPTQLDEVVGQIAERWEDQDVDEDAIRAEIVRGMKEQAKEWPREGNEHVWDVIDSVEK